MRVMSGLLLSLTACSTAIHTPSQDPAAEPGLIPTQTWVGVQIPADWPAQQELSLEVGDQAWSIIPEEGGGVVSSDLSRVASVRLVRVDDCHVVAAFEAGPRAYYSISLASDGSALIEEVEAMAAGPGLIERDGGLTGCG